MRANLAGLKCVCDEIMRAIKSAESSAIFLLVGDIGAGKTTLVREFAKQVGIKESVTSPTFSLLHIYDLDSAESQNLGKNNSVRSTQTRPLRGAKNLIQASSSGKADFLLEADKRGSPPKSEKAAAFWRVGGAGRGVQPFLREKSKLSGENGDGSTESSLDSANSQNLTLFPTIYHYDLFNRNLSELLDLGLLDLLSENGIHFVEWGDRRLFEIIKDAFENIFILQITKAKNDRIYELKREF